MKQTRKQAGKQARSEHQSIGQIPCVVLGVMLVMGIGIAGCQKTALRPDDNRSQFDRYDQSRSQRAQPFLEDEFGRRTPNLSERLLVRDD